MTTADTSACFAPSAEDRAAISALVAGQFASLSWRPSQSADWEHFTAPFLPGAPLYPSSRPAQSLGVAAFVERMRRLSTTDLLSFREEVGAEAILAFGNVAVATALCHAEENGAPARGTVEMLLLVKEGGAWRIAAQAWDKV